MECDAEILRALSLVSSVASPAKDSTPAHPGKRRYARLAFYYFCYYFESIWGHLVTAYNHGIPANRKGMLKTRDMPTLTCLSPPTHQLGLQSPPLRHVLTGVERFKRIRADEEVDRALF